MIGILFIMGWTVATMLPFFLALNYFGWLRSEAVEELVGLDVCYNGEDIGNAGAESKGGSDASEIVREEYLDAYEDYRKKQQSQAASKTSLPKEEPAKVIEPGYTDDSASNTDSLLEPPRSYRSMKPAEGYQDEISL